MLGFKYEKANFLVFHICLLTYQREHEVTEKYFLVQAPIE